MRPAASRHPGDRTGEPVPPVHAHLPGALLVLDAVEVTRPAVTSGIGAGANVTGVASAAATVTLVGLLVGRSRRAGLSRTWTRTAWVLALALTVVELVLRMVDLLATLAASSPWEALADRRSAALAARLVLLGLVVLVERSAEALSEVERRRADVVLAVLLVVTVALDTPRGGDLATVAIQVAAVVVVSVVAGWLAVALHDRRPDLRGSPIGTFASLLAAGVLAIPLVAPPVQPTSSSQVVEFAGGTVDLTVAPATVGGNEVHLYVFDVERRQIDMQRGTVRITGGGDSELLPAGGNHLVAYDLVLPESATWDLSVEAETTDGRTLRARTQLERP